MTANLIAEMRREYPLPNVYAEDHAVNLLADSLETVTAERDALAAILAEAPHAPGCRLFDAVGHRSVQLPESACDCWKSKFPEGAKR